MRRKPSLGGGGRSAVASLLPSEFHNMLGTGPGVGNSRTICNVGRSPGGGSSFVRAMEKIDVGKITTSNKATPKPPVLQLGASRASTNLANSLMDSHIRPNDFALLTEFDPKGA